ncbi:MAG: LptF/LptG family permease [Candidatus Melainabacteria bacterium]|nr:LptF/LptG family permease [Candidatus Melainabacteria bacterium]
MRIVKVLDSFIVGEQLHFTYIFVLTLLGVFFGTSEISAIIRKIAEAGIPAKTALYIVAMHLPGGIVDCLPAAVLISTLFVLHRMCIDSELVALLTCGISFARIISGVLLAGLIWSALSFVVSEYVVPQSKRTTWGLMAIGVSESRMPVAKKSTADVQIEIDNLGRICSTYIFAGKYYPNHLTNVTAIVVVDQKVTSVTNAATGAWKSGRWILTDGRIFNFANSEHGSVSSFGKIELPANKGLTTMYEQSMEGPENFCTPNLVKYIDAHGGPNAPPYLLMQLYKRYSRPLGCFFVLLAAIPMALSGRKSRTWLGMAYAGLILCLYYSLVSSSVGLAENGRLSPLIAAWLPNIAVGIVGLVTFSLKMRRASF